MHSRSSTQWMIPQAWIGTSCSPCKRGRASMCVRVRVCGVSVSHARNQPPWPRQAKPQQPRANLGKVNHGIGGKEGIVFALPIGGCVVLRDRIVGGTRRMVRGRCGQKWGKRGGSAWRNDGEGWGTQDGLYGDAIGRCHSAHNNSSQEQTKRGPFNMPVAPAFGTKMSQSPGITPQLEKATPP